MEYNLEGEYLTFTELLKACNFDQLRADTVVRRRQGEAKGVIVDPNDGITDKYWWSTKQTTSRRSVSTDVVSITTAAAPDANVASMLESDGPFRVAHSASASSPSTPRVEVVAKAKSKAKASASPAGVKVEASLLSDPAGYARLWWTHQLSTTPTDQPVAQLIIMTRCVVCIVVQGHASCHDVMTSLLMTSPCDDDDDDYDDDDDDHHDHENNDDEDDDDDDDDDHHHEDDDDDVSSHPCMRVHWYDVCVMVTTLTGRTAYARTSARRGRCP